MPEALPQKHSEAEDGLEQKAAPPPWARFSALLEDPAHAANPLREPFAELLALYTKQQEKQSKLLCISDGYHDLSRAQNSSLHAQYDRQLRRLQKIARISDRYQHSLHELSSALEEAALTDPLTGLHNRRYLMERLKKETQRSNRKADAFSLAILDVDHFKSINDRFSHEAGDFALCQIATAIQGSIREYDICGRWGGEEFLILLPDTSLTAALQVCERIRHDIAQLHLALLEPMELPHLTASIGLAMQRPEENYSTTLDRADSALHAAKRQGRNRVEFA